MKKKLIDSSWDRYQCISCCSEEIPCVLFVPENTPNPTECPYADYSDPDWQKME